MIVKDIEGPVSFDDVVRIEAILNKPEFRELLASHGQRVSFEEVGKLKDQLVPLPEASDQVRQFFTYPSSCPPPLRDLLIEIGEWAEKTFKSEDARGKILHLREEVDELLENLSDEEEWADCFLLLFDGARKQGFTFEQITELIYRKYQKNLTRTWKEEAGGVYHHVKEEAA